MLWLIIGSLQLNICAFYPSVSKMKPKVVKNYCRAYAVYLYILLLSTRFIATYD